MFRRKTTSEDDIRAALNSVENLNYSNATILLEDGNALVTLEIDPAQAANLEKPRLIAQARISSLRGVKSANVILTSQREGQAENPAPKNPVALPDVKHIIAVASGKGGVGKSTVAANLAVAMAKSGLRVGLLDADIYGPSAPTLFGVRGQKPEQANGQLIPLRAHGVDVMSMGMLVSEEAPMVWRGPMVQKAIVQLLRDVAWGKLDILILDMPPGTGDAQLTVAQKIPLSGAVIVSTPQDIALLDSVKGVEMFRKLNVPVLGIVENMSLFCCPNCNTQTPIFGHGGAERRASELGVPFLGALPLDPALREASDKGTPPAGEAFQAIAGKIISTLK